MKYSYDLEHLNSQVTLQTTDFQIPKSMIIPVQYIDYFSDDRSIFHYYA